MKSCPRVRALRTEAPRRGSASGCMMTWPPCRPAVSGRPGAGDHCQLLRASGTVCRGGEVIELAREIPRTTSAKSAAAIVVLSRSTCSTSISLGPVGFTVEPEEASRVKVDDLLLNDERVPHSFGRCPDRGDSLYATGPPGKFHVVV